MNETSMRTEFDKTWAKIPHCEVEMVAVNKPILQEWFNLGYAVGMARGREETMKLLASATKKILPPEMVQEIIDRADPLAAFLQESGMGAAPGAEGEK